MSGIHAIFSDLFHSTPVLCSLLIAATIFQLTEKKKKERNLRASVKQQMYNIIEMYDSEFGRVNIVIATLCVRSLFYLCIEFMEILAWNTNRDAF